MSPMFCAVSFKVNKLEPPSMQRAKTTSRELNTLSDTTRNMLLEALAEALVKAAPEILAANAKDLGSMPKDDPLYDRLLLNTERLLAMASDIKQIAKLPCPIGKILQETIRPNALRIQKVSVPLGVIGIVY